MFNTMQTVKRRFFAMRNGLLAAQMRQGGLNYRINFGLNLPQIKDIAAEINGWDLSECERTGLARELWNNESTRESRLLAPMIFHAASVDYDEAKLMLLQAQTAEVSDVLCHSLLRHMPFAEDLIQDVITDTNSSETQFYTALRLLLNMLISRKIEPARANSLTKHLENADAPSIRRLLTQISSELQFQSSESC